MATLSVKNIPDELYRARRKRARHHRRSVAEEIRAMLRENVPTPSVLQKRQKICIQLQRLRSSHPPGRGPFPRSEETQREDRER